MLPWADGMRISNQNRLFILQGTKHIGYQTIQRPVPPPDDVARSDTVDGSDSPLDVLGEDVEAVRQDDHVPRPPGDDQPALGVEASRVARVVPALGVEDLGGRLGVPPVALEERGAAEEDLAVGADQIGALSSTEIQAFTTTQISYMSTTQFAALI